MVKITAKDYLNQLRVYESKLTSRQDELEAMKRNRVYISGISYDRDRVQSSPDGSNAMNKISEQICDMEQELRSEMITLVNMRHSIITEINSLERAEYIDLLSKRYVHYMNFEDISDAMGYSYSKVTKLHGIALQAFTDKFSCKLKV